jgi:glycosyltransferase involved in cell wall biosynthesis
MEPRAPRHAFALASLSDEIEVVFIDSQPRGQERVAPKLFEGLKNLEYRTNYFAYRGEGRARLLFDKLRHWRDRVAYKAFGSLGAGALSTRALGLESMLREVKADVYLGYNIDTLVPISRAAARTGALTIFDCQEFYSDMGHWQTDFEKRLIESIERRYLPECALVLAASDELANELARVYQISRPLPLYNVPPGEPQLDRKKEAGFTLYWRNSSINLNQRGLGDGLKALSLLPSDVRLHVQGRLSEEDHAQLERVTQELGVRERVVVHPPYQPHEAITVAAPYRIGLCLEQSGCRNHDLTVSNKMFDYMMAGLAVIASDLPGLRDVIGRSGGGLLYRRDDAEDLAAKLRSLYDDRELLDQLAARARAFALSEGNLEFEMKKLQAAFSALVSSKKRADLPAYEGRSAEAASR